MNISQMPGAAIPIKDCRRRTFASVPENRLMIQLPQRIAPALTGITHEAVINGRSHASRSEATEVSSDSYVHQTT